MAKTFASDYLLAIRATSPLSGMERIAPFFVVTRYAAAGGDMGRGVTCYRALELTSGFMICNANICELPR